MSGAWHNFRVRLTPLATHGLIGMNLNDRIKANLLTEDNLRELVKLTNEEISQAKEQYEERLAGIEVQLEDVRRRLHKLYDALETGKLEVENLAPRIERAESSEGV